MFALEIANYEIAFKITTMHFTRETKDISNLRVHSYPLHTMKAVTSEQANKAWPQYVATSIAMLTLFDKGLHNGWSSPSIPKLLHTYGVSREDVSYISALPSVGSIFGALAASLLVDVVGRKRTLLLTGPLSVAAFALIRCLRASTVLLYLGRTTAGLVDGLTTSTIILYVCEIAEPRIRGTLGSFHTFYMFCGILSMNLLGTRCSVETTASIAAAAPALFFVLFVAMPETPYYYLMKRNSEEAARSLKKLRRRDAVDEELARMRRDVERQMSERGSLMDLFATRSNRKAMTILCVLTVVKVFTGIIALGMYSQVFFAEATDAVPEDWAAVVVLVVKMPFTFVAVAAADRVGRRPLLMASTCGCCVSMVALGVFLSVKDFCTAVDLSALDWFPLFGMIAFSLSYVAGLGVVVDCLWGELLAARAKAKGVCVVNVVHGVASFASTKMYQSLADNVSLGLPLLVFAVVQGFGFVYCWKWVPETKGKSLEEIQQGFKQI